VKSGILAGNKETEKARVIREVLRPLGRVQAWAHRTGDAVLLGRTDFSPTDLDVVSDAEIIGRLETLLTLMRGVIGQIPSVPSARLDALDDEVDGLEALLGTPRSEIVDRRAAGEAMETELKAATAVLINQHDMIVRDYDYAAPAIPAEVRQKELFGRWRRRVASWMRRRRLPRRRLPRWWRRRRIGKVAQASPPAARGDSQAGHLRHLGRV